MTIFLLVSAILVSLAAAAFFAGAETGFLSVSRERVLHIARSGGRKAQIVEQAISRMALTTTTLLIGNNLASTAYSAAAAALCADLFAESAVASAIWRFLAAFTVLYVSEFMPKLLCAARPLRRTLAMAPAYRVMAAMLYPLTALSMRITDLFIPRREHKYKLTQEDLLRILQDRKDGVKLSDFESALIGRILVLRVKGRPITPEAILSVLR